MESALGGSVFLIENLQGSDQESKVAEKIKKSDHDLLKAAQPQSKKSNRDQEKLKSDQKIFTS